MKMKFKLSKRFLSILLAVVMVVGMLPFSALTAYAATEVPSLLDQAPITYTDGATQYIKYDNYLYKVTYTNIKSDAVTNAVTKLDFTRYTYDNLALSILGSDKTIPVINQKNRFLTLSDLPKTVGSVLNGYTIQGNAQNYENPIVTITCLAVDEPVWTWNGSSAKAVFTSTDGNAMMTVNATTAVSSSEPATDCLEQDKTVYTATATCNGKQYTDTHTVYGNVKDHEWGEWTVTKTTHSRVCKANSSHTQSGSHTTEGGSAATCDKPAVCGVCKSEYGVDLGHNYIYTVKSGTTNVLVETCINNCGHTAEATLTAEDQTYSGYVVYSAATLTFDKNWQGGKSGGYSYPADSTNVGTVTVASYPAGYKIYTTFNITPYDISGDKIDLDLAHYEYTYNGKEQIPQYTVGFNNSYLQEGVDYDAVWSAGDYTSVGTYRLVITGKGNFEGSRYVEYTIGKGTPAFTAPAAKELTYTGEPMELVQAGSVNPGTLMYSLDGQTYSEKIPVAADPGSYTVYYKVDGQDTINYNEILSGSVAVTIGKATPTIADFDIELPQDGVYDGSKYTASVSVKDGVNGIGDVTVKYNGNTTPPTDAGTYKVSIEVKESAIYNAVSDLELGEFIIAKAPALAAAPIANTLTYNKSAQDLVNNGSAIGGEMQYALGTDATNAPATGWNTTVPKGTGAGTYYVWYKVVGDSNHNDVAPACVEVTVNKATYDMSSAKWNYTDAFKYDGKEHKVEVVGLPNGVTVGAYSGNTATVVGDYTAKVTLTYDANNYNIPSVADLSWKVENNYTPSEYTVNGDGWMNHEFVIKANDGYQVSLTNTADGVWADAIAYHAETDNGSVTFYLKNEADGTISLAGGVSYKIDKTAPTGTVEFVDRTGWQEFVNTITFGLFYKDEVTVKITGADTLSDVATIEYYASNEGLTLDEVKTIDNWTEYTDSFGVSVEDTKKFVYYVRITDNAGNMIYISTDGAEYDITAPVISGIENGKTYYTTQKVIVTDKNLDTVTLNGNAVTDAITLDGNKDVTYTIVATDKAGNSTTVTVTMKPISDLSAPIDALNKDNVNSGDEQAVDGVKAAVAAVDTTNATDEEKAALKEIADKAAELEKVIDDTKAEIARITEEMNKHNGATVNSDDAEALEQLAKDIQELLDGDNLTDAERTALTEDAGKVADMQKTVADTTAENKRISDAVDGYDLATVTSDDKADLEQLLADIEKQLESTNLTEEEISDLNGDKKAVEDLLTKIEGTDELIDKLIEDVNEYSDDTVKSTDKDAIEQIIEDIDALLETENLTEDEKKDLEDAKDKAEGLLDTIDNATKATETENTEKVKDVTAENVTPEDKTDLEKAKADLEKALEDYGDNYTDDETKAIEDEIKRIDDALKVVENVEGAEGKINALPENITKDDTDDVDAAKKAYDELSDYEKTLVDPEAKKKLDEAIKAAEEANKPADTNSPQTSDNSNMTLWFTLMFGSLAALFAILFGTKKKKSEDK